MLQKKLLELNRELLEFSKTLESEPVLSVHGMRKRTKFMRALLKADKEKNIQAIVILQKVSRILSPYRDAQVMLDTYERFIKEKQQADPLVEELLRANPFLEDPHPDMFEMHTVNDLLEQLRSELETLDTNIDDDTLEAYLQSKSAKSGKRYMAALSGSDPDTVHAWRKKAKQVWYILRLKDGESIQDDSHIVNRYDRLGKLLGSVHDIDVLDAFIHTHFKNFPSEHLMSQRAELLDQAFTLGKELLD